MSYKDLRDWIEQVEAMGELSRVMGAHWDLEIGTLSRIGWDRGSCNALLFDEIKGYPKGYRLLASSMASIKRQALTLGLPDKDYGRLEFVKACRDRLNSIRSIPPKRVKTGPIMENVHKGEDIDALEFPAPRWDELDGGRYLGTSDLVITRDPDEGWVNLGTYRVMVHDKTTLANYISPGKHGWMHREKYFAQGKPMPVAVSVGHDPLLFLASCHELPYGTSEYDIAGGIKGEPIEVIEAPYTGLPVPAHAEIVIEGEVISGEEREEGPFTEWSGYYGSGVRPEPIIKIKTIMHRNDPIMLGRSPLLLHQAIRTAIVWDQLEKAGVPDVKGVWYMEGGGPYLLLVVSIKQRYLGHAKQAALVAGGCHGGAYVGRYVIVVDDDIDPSNTREVLWAIATRSDPERSIEIIRRCWSEPLDPAIHVDEQGHKWMNSRAIIDACKPFEWINDFPLVVRINEEVRQRVMSKWGDIYGQ